MKSRRTLVGLLALGAVLAVATAAQAAITDPTDIAGLRLWLDADDTTTLWQDAGGTVPVGSNGDLVRLWQDKSGNANHVATINDGDRPNYNTSTGFSGTSAGNALWFDGDNMQHAGSIGILGDQDMTMISVWADAVNTGQHYQHTVHYGKDSTRQAYGHAVLRTEDNMIANHYWGDGFSTTASGLGTPIVAISTWDGDGGSGSNGLDSWWVNGVPSGTREVDLNIGNNNSGETTLTIGSRLAPQAEGIRGNIAEVIVFDSVLSAADMNEIGWYLTEKWGLTTSYTKTTDLSWDGVANGNWSDPHWVTPPPVFPDATTNAEIGPLGTNNTVTVDGNHAAQSLTITGNGALILGAGNSLDVGTDLEAAGRPVTLQNNATLRVGGGGAIGSVATQGDATIENGGDIASSHLVMQSGDRFTKGGAGKLSFDLSAGSNTIDASNTIQVNGGELAMQAASNPIGGADLILDGGTFTVQGNVVPVFNQVNYAQYNGANDPNAHLVGIDDGLPNGQNGGLFSLTPTSESAWTGEFYQGDLGSNYSVMWWGDFHAPVDGVYQIYTHGDDYEISWLDSNQDGDFDAGASEKITENVPPEGWNTPKTGSTISLTAGQAYPFAIAGMEWGGGAWVEASIDTPGAGGMVRINPSDPAQSNWWSRDVNGAVDMTDTDVDVLASSTLNAVSDLSASFGALTLQDGILTTQGASGGMSFTGTTVALGATRVGFDTQTNTTPGVIDGSNAAATIVKTGPADLVLDQQGVNLGNATFDVQQGRMKVQYGSDPTGGADIVLSGGTLTAQGEQVDVMLDGLSGSIFRGIPRNESHLNLDGATYQFSPTRVFTGDKAGTILTDAEDPNNNVRVTGSTQNWGAFPNFNGNADDFVTAYSGQFTPDVTGTYNFHWNNDDRGLMYIDLDHSGTFENSERVANYAWNANGNVDLNAGEAYNVIYMAQEFGGGQSVWWAMTEPGGSEAIIDPSDGRGTWQTLVSGFNSVDIQNTLIVDNVPVDALAHKGYHVQPDADMNLDNNSGLMAITPWGEALLTDGPGGRGLDFDNDTDFINTGAIGRNDNYMNLFLATFHAPEDGNYEFRNAGDDDRAGIWIDLDRDGIFESSVPGLGSNRGEQLSWEDGGTKSVSLTGGLDYLVAFTHGEYGGGSRCDFRFKTPSMGSQVVVKPSDPAQAGLWSVTPISTLELLTDLDANLKELVLKNGYLRITGGNLLTVEQASISTATSGSVGLILDTPTVLTDVVGLIGNGQTVEITKKGAADLILNKQGTGLENATFNVVQGRLVAYAGSNPLGEATLKLSGGEALLSSTGADPALFDNDVQVTADSTLTAGQGPDGVPGPITVQLGSAGKTVSIDAGKTLTMHSTDNYTLDVAGALNSGNLKVTEGTVALNGGGTVAKIEVKAAATAGTPGVTVEEEAKLGGVKFKATGASFGLRGDDLASPTATKRRTLSLSGGQVDVRAGGEPEGLIAYWPFEQGSGTVAYDQSGGGHDGNITGAQWVDDPARGWVLDFEGKDYVDIPDASATFASIVDTQAITIGLWQYGDAGIQPQNDWIFEGRDGGRQFSSHLPWGNSRIYWDAFGNYDRIDKAASPDLFEGQWNHWVFTKDRATGTMRMYLNGNSSPWHSGTGKNRTYTNVTRFKIGADAGGGGNYDGMIDDFIVFNRVLTDAEIAALYAGTLLAAPAIDLPYTDIEVSADSTLWLDTSDPAVLGNLALIGADLAVAGGAPSVSFGALSGDGTVAGPEVILRERLVPGGSIGTLTVDGDLTLLDGVVYSWELDSTANDLTNVTGDLALSDWTLRILDGGLMRTITPSEEFVLFNYGTLPGGVGSWSIVDATGLGYRFSTAGAQILDDAANSRVILTGILAVVPEPATIAIWSLLAMLGLAAGWRRRRK